MIVPKLVSIFVSVALASTVSVSALAGKWPTPAAGTSKSGDPEVVLTFDDGPHEKYTPIILGELEDRGLQAIFFWVGHRALKNGKHRKARLGVIEQAVRAGHLIGNHTINHAHLCSVKADEAAREIDEAAALYAGLTRLPITLFRAPYGDKCQRLEGLLADRGMTHMHWDIDPREWLDHDSKRTAAYIIRKLKRLDGRAVILMHDTKLATVRALPIVLDWIASENERRVKTGKKAIRLLSASEVVGESMDLELIEWAQEAGSASLSRVGAALSGLVPGYRSTILTQR